MRRSNFELTTVRLNRDTRKRVKEWAKAYDVSQGIVIRQMLEIGERHFLEEAFRKAEAGGNINP
jgi:predicted transcriptional regulator